MFKHSCVMHNAEIQTLRRFLTDPGIYKKSAQHLTGRTCLAFHMIVLRKHRITNVMVDTYRMLCGKKQFLRKSQAVPAAAIQRNKQIIHHIRFCRRQCSLRIL